MGCNGRKTNKQTVFVRTATKSVCFVMILYVSFFNTHYNEMTSTQIFRVRYQIYRVSQEEWTKLWESVPYVEL